MHRTLIAVFLALVEAAPLAGAMEPPQAVQGATAYRMQVQGMACPFCAYNVEQRFNRMAGVQYVDVNLDKGQVVVVTAKDTKLTRAQVADLYQEAGFKLESMKEVSLNRANLANQ